MRQSMVKKNTLSLNKRFSCPNKKFSIGIRKDIILWSYHNMELLFSNIKYTNAEN